MTNKDPYDILGVSRKATQDEIKRAYRRLAKQYHPDRNPNDKSAEGRFKEVRAAYEVIGDPRRRAQYDRFGAGGPAPDIHAWATGRRGVADDIPFDFGSIGDLTSIFEQFFRRGMGGKTRSRRSPRDSPRTAPRGGDIEHTVELSFVEAVQGTVRDVVLTSPGPDRTEEQIRFRVPAGVADGQRVRVRGKGQEGPGGRGDLMIRIRARSHQHFRREGLDLLLDLPLTFAEAAQGTQVEIPTLDGATVVKVPAGTSGGTKLRLRGRGVRDARSGKTGDLYASVRIRVPKDLSPRARQLVQDLDRELNQRPREELGWSK